jgi:hypothetical protein
MIERRLTDGGMGLSFKSSSYQYIGEGKSARNI